ncbi:unnamed protein product [Protopolystoma xenopodis]|uniref:Uncharacterized protein n=1 Tax=Protopolystoma xenopodis TaxID=117903 RepID=A0A448WQY8_9PLAT|nr:unnamed protein product [Protopolystoma xenopodis]
MCKVEKRPPERETVGLDINRQRPRGASTTRNTQMHTSAIDMGPDQCGGTLRPGRQVDIDSPTTLKAGYYSLFALTANREYQMLHRGYVTLFIYQPNMVGERIREELKNFVFKKFKLFNEYGK